MKNKSKVLILLFSAMLLVGASVLGTMAYLTSSETVTNTFTVGSVKITLDEQDVDDSDKDGDITDRDKENSYKLLPGHLYTKDPIIHVADTSEDCFLFVKVVDEIADIQDADTVATQMGNKGWKPVEGVANTYVYVGTADGASAPFAVSAKSNITVFESFKIKGSVTNDELAKYKDKTITVTAYAVQKDGFENKTALEIWNETFGAPAEQG